MEAGSGVFKSNDELLLEKTQKYRLEMIDDLMEDGVPNNMNNVRVVNELLNDVDKQIMDKTKLTNKQEADDKNGNIANMVVEILANISSDGPTMSTNRQLEIPDDILTLDVVPGETAISPEELNLSDFINEGNDEYRN